MAWTPNRCEICGEVSTFTLTSLTLPARSRASCSSAGLTMRQGPHQGAHKSTTTGILAASATSAKVASSASAIHGSASWHVPQRGVPAAAVGTRLVLPQCPHRTSPLVMALLFRSVPATRPEHTAVCPGETRADPAQAGTEHAEVRGHPAQRLGCYAPGRRRYQSLVSWEQGVVIRSWREPKSITTAASSS